MFYISAIFLENGNVCLVFDLGSGSIKLKSATNVTLNQWNTVEVTRTLKLGTLRLNSGPEVVGVTLGSNVALEVGDVSYLGGVPLSVGVRRGVDTDTSFNGCMRKVMTSSITLRLEGATEGYGISHCTLPACEDNLCRSGSTCTPDTSVQRGYRCVCPQQYTGRCFSKYPYL